MSGLRDLALIAAMFYSFARVSAVLKLKVDDYYHNGARRRLRLHEKGGKEHDMPVHHLLERILDEYIVVAGPLERVFSPPVGCHTWRAIGMNFIRRFGMS